MEGMPCATPVLNPGRFGSERASDGETAGGETDITVVTELARDRSIASKVTRNGGSAAHDRHRRRKGTAFTGEWPHQLDRAVEAAAVLPAGT